jgi:hypothetical protein
MTSRLTSAASWTNPTFKDIGNRNPTCVCVWTGKAGPITWPPRSPDFTALWVADGTFLPALHKDTPSRTFAKLEKCLIQCTLFHIFMCIYRYISLLSVIKQFEVTAAANGRTLIRCINASYAVGHELACRLSFRCIVCIIWVLIIFWCGYAKYTM